MIIDCQYIRRVKDYMPTVLPRPKLKPTVIVNYDEWLPIVSVECEV